MTAEITVAVAAASVVGITAFVAGYTMAARDCQHLIRQTLNLIERIAT